MLLIRPDLKVVLQGYTDSTGSAELNQKLSERRALAVSTFLIEQGVSSTRMEIRGLGATNPLMDNNTAKGRQKNRRVDILVTGESIQEPVGSESSSSS